MTPKCMPVPAAKCMKEQWGGSQSVVRDVLKTTSTRANHRLQPPSYVDRRSVSSMVRWTSSLVKLFAVRPVHRLLGLLRASYFLVSAAISTWRCDVTLQCPHIWRTTGSNQLVYDEKIPSTNGIEHRPECASACGLAGGHLSLCVSVCVRQMLTSWCSVRFHRRMENLCHRGTTSGHSRAETASVVYLPWPIDHCI